jgi:hypothetical protein
MLITASSISPLNGLCMIVITNEQSTQHLAQPPLLDDLLTFLLSLK